MLVKKEKNGSIELVEHGRGNILRMELSKGKLYFEIENIYDEDAFNFDVNCENLQKIKDFINSLEEQKEE